MNKYINTKNEFIAIRKAFPSVLDSEVSKLLSEINVYTKYNASFGFEVLLENRLVEIPGRVYWEEHRLLERGSFSPTQSEILACIMTRHHNGYIREQYLKHILSSDKKWVTPYIVQLVGEYVFEILEFIWSNFGLINLQNLINFINSNELFWHKTKQRIYSYWDCYQRYKGSPKNEYVGFLLLERIENLQ